MNKHFATIVVTLNGIIIAGFLGVHGWLPPVPEKIEEIIEERKIEASRCRNCTSALDLSPGAEKLDDLPDSNGKNIRFIITHVTRPKPGLANNICFETPRLLFREIRKTDAQALFNYARKPEVAARTLWQAHRSKLDSIALVNQWIEMAEKNYFSPWVIVDKESGSIIGTSKVTEYNPIDTRCRISYSLDSDFWHQEYELEIVRAMIELAMIIFRCGRVGILVRQAIPEIADILAKAGMNYEGTEPEYKYSNGNYISCDIYSVLKKDVDARLLKQSVLNQINQAH